MTYYFLLLLSMFLAVCKSSLYNSYAKKEASLGATIQFNAISYGVAAVIAMIGMLIGMVIGLSGLKLPGWMDNVVDTCSSCMSPIAMLLTGMTVANIDLKNTFMRKDLYAISLVRLLVFPILGLIFFALVPMPREIVICSMVTLAMPLGLNTIVVPSAYGRDTTAAAGMALISHIISVATIPVVFMVLSMILG